MSSSLTQRAIDEALEYVAMWPDRIAADIAPGDSTHLFKWRARRRSSQRNKRWREFFVWRVERDGSRWTVRRHSVAPPFKRSHKLVMGPGNERY